MTWLRTRIRTSLAEVAVLLLIATLVATLWTLTSESRRAAAETVDRAFDSAEVMSRFAESAHEHFTDSVNPVASAYGIPFTTDSSADDEAMRFPATFSRTLTESFSEQFPESQFRIYSEYPIRQEDIDGRVLDPFAMTAIERLRHAPLEMHREVVDLDDNTTLVRLASPIVMQSGCVDCHNSQAFAATNRIWEVGDVRGVREVTLTIPSSPAFNIWDMPELFALVGLASALALFLVLPSVRREKANRADLTRRAKELEHEVGIDGLSGLHNRRSFDDKLALMVDTAHTERTALTLLSFDIDLFKRINDTHGHSGGDVVIRGLGEVLTNEVRRQDIAARTGGEEFAVLAADMSREEQVAFAGRVETAISKHRFAIDGKKVGITISGGCVTLRPGETAPEFCKRADQLLYQAKRTGRARICFGTEIAG